MIDFSVLQAITENDAELMNELLTMFVETAKADSQRLQQALQSREHQTIETLAHRVKGSAAMIGATAFADICGEIEQQARLGTQDYQGLLAMFQRVYQQTIADAQSKISA